MNGKKVAVVILNWNGKKYLQNFLPSVISNSKSEDITLWVADNGSIDDSVHFLETNYPEIHIIKLDKNYGFAGGYNKALEQIDAEYYVILNSDVEVTPNWIEPIISYLDNNQDVAAIQPKILSYQDKTQFEYAGAAGGFIDKYGYPFCRGRILDTFEKDNNQYNEIANIFWATGACLFIRANIFRSQKFDADFFAHMEEIDLCWRINNQNQKIQYFPSVTVFHVGGGTLPNTNPFKLYLNYRNNLLLLYKNLPRKNYRRIIITRMLLDGLSGLIYVLKFQFSNFAAVLKAHLSFYKLIYKFKDKRKSLEINNIEHEKIIYKKSIVFDYFIRKKRIFTQLNF
jgi:GT2 family glycosyltransferase